MVYRGRVEHGGIVLNSGVELPEGAEVKVELLTDGADEDTSIGPLLEIPDLAVDTGFSDLATNVDHYLYGHPRASDAE